MPVSWIVEGEVVRGDQRGRLLGFPTANLVVNRSQPATPASDGISTSDAAPPDESQRGTRDSSADSVTVLDSVLPPDGVYTGIVELTDGSRHGAAVSVGTRPQFYASSGARLVEAHLLDFEGSLYGQKLRVEIGARMRGQQVFTSDEELVAQMARDVAMVRQSAEA